MTEVRAQGPPASRSVWQSPLWAVIAAAVALGLAAYGFASAKGDFGILLVAVALVFLGSAALQRLHHRGDAVLAPGFMLVVALGGFLDDNVVIGLLGLSGAICLGLADRSRATRRAG